MASIGVYARIRPDGTGAVADGDGNADGDDNPQVLGFIVFALAIVLLARIIVVLPLCAVAARFTGGIRETSLPGSKKVLCRSDWHRCGLTHVP